MQAVVQKVNLKLPYCDAKTSNDILVVFRPSMTNPPHLGDILDFDLLKLDCEQTVSNLTLSTSFPVTIQSNDVHDLRLPSGHGTSRLPSIERRTSSQK